jgi:hypothetical protein
MGFGKKIKKHIKLTPELYGPSRRQEMLDQINQYGTFLPKSILHEDLDRGFLDFVKNELRVVVDGKVVPVVDILITTQNWAQFTQTWNINDLDKNVSVPVITTVRSPEVKYGTLPSLQYTIPNRKQFFYAMVPNWDNGVRGMDVYTIPQPVPVDIKFSIKIICNRMRELNSFNKVVVEKFSSRQAYTVIKGHYIPIIMDDLQDESVTEIEKRKYYIQSYNFTMMGFLMDENEFQVSPGVSRTFTLLETNQRSAKIKKNRRALDNTSNFDLVLDFPFGENNFTQEFKYPANLKSVGLDNIDTYDVLINGLFYGSNIFDNVDGVIRLNSDDVLSITVQKTDNTIPAKIQLAVELTL